MQQIKGSFWFIYFLFIPNYNNTTGLTTSLLGSRKNATQHFKIRASYSNIFSLLIDIPNLNVMFSLFPTWRPDTY